MVKFAVVLPARTVTDDGTVAALTLSEDRLTTMPPLGAAALKVTVPVDDVPPITDVGKTATVVRLSCGARISQTIPDESTPPAVAVPYILPAVSNETPTAGCLPSWPRPKSCKST